jgi:uncharacterized delta-60 repeat protein
MSSFTSRVRCVSQILAAVFATALSVLAAPPTGTIDPTFNPDTPLKIGAGRSNSVLLQPDGKILVAGEFNGVNAAFTPAVVRFNPDGSLDNGFKAGSLPFPGIGSSEDSPRLLALQPNGQVLVASHISDADGGTRYLTRLNSDGSLDAAFYPRFDSSDAGSPRIFQAAVLADGKILISGGFTKVNGVARPYLARLNSNGSLDETFNPAAAPLNFVLQSTGKIVGPIFSGSDYHLIRLNPDGSLDSSFVSTAVSDGYLTPRLLVQPDDKLIFTIIHDGMIPEYLTTIVRLTADGKDDPTFQPFTSHGGIPLLVESDGKILIKIIFESGPSRLRANGTPDNNFNPEGWGYAVVQQPDGKLVTAGDDYNPPYGIRRLLLDGTRDQSFAPGLGLTVLTTGGLHHAALLPDGRIVVTGDFNYIGDIPRKGIALLKTDGKVDPGFDAGTLVGQQSNGSFKVNEIAVQPDGKILIAIDQLVRITNTGAIDPSFHYTPTKSGGGISSVRIQSDGKILVLGPDGLVRLEANAALDSSFHAAENGAVMFVQPDGKIMVRGGSRGLTRLFGDGSLDASFAGVGGISGYNFPYAAALQPDGKVLVSGPDPQNFRNIFVRLNPDGSNDATFAPNIASVYRIAIDQNGIYVGGDIAPQADVSVRQKQIGVQRLKFDGHRDDSFGPVHLDPAAQVNELLLQADGRLLIAGEFDLVNGLQRHGIVRITDAGARKMANISTRANVGTGQRVEIAGFIVTGNAPKKVIVRAIGPSLQSFGIASVLANPLLELRNSGGAVIARNDNWRDTQESEILTTGIAPTNPSESAIIATLAPGSYTAVVQGVNGGEGVALAEIYDLDPASDSALANISTRAFVENSNPMISGVIVHGTETGNLVVRALGPSLAATISGPLQNPALSVYDQSGTLVAANDDWKAAQRSELELRGLGPTDDRESAILTTLVPGTYTAVVRGVAAQNGVGLIEVYCLNP